MKFAPSERISRPTIFKFCLATPNKDESEVTFLPKASLPLPLDDDSTNIVDEGFLAGDGEFENIISTSIQSQRFAEEEEVEGMVLASPGPPPNDDTGNNKIDDNNINNNNSKLLASPLPTYGSNQPPMMYYYKDAAGGVPPAYASSPSSPSPLTHSVFPQPQRPTASPFYYKPMEYSPTSQSPRSLQPYRYAGDY